jgi:ketopantoate reductase
MAETVQEGRRGEGNSPSVDVVGAGRIGGALHERARQRGVAGVLVTRTSGWDELATEPGRPILVCTRNDDLADVVARVPPGRRSDLVFVQNGMLRPWLAEHGLAGATRGILFVAVPSRGAPIEVGGASPFCGPHAEAVVRWLGALDVAARVVDPDAFAAVELEKLVWNCVFGLLSQALDEPVGAICDRHAWSLKEVVEELLSVGEPALGVQVDHDELLARLCDYSRSIAGWRGAVREWRWRNGWFVDEAARRGVTLPAHDRWLARAGVAR